MVRLHLAGREPDIDAMLVRVQNDLFDLGSRPMRPGSRREAALRAAARQRCAGQAPRGRDRSDERDPRAAAIFVLPGGTPAGAALHVVPTVSRRAERLIVELSTLPNETVSAPVLKYINRLSDFLFVAGRCVNDRGKADVLSVPGKTGDGRLSMSAVKPMSFRPAVLPLRPPAPRRGHRLDSRATGP